jgi:hypothetical protein
LVSPVVDSALVFFQLQFLFSPVDWSCLSLQAINRGAEVIECQNAQVGLDKILGITAFSLDRLLEADPDFLVRGVN